MDTTSKRHWLRRKKTIVTAIALITLVGLGYALFAPGRFITPEFEIGGTIEIVVLDEQDNRIAGASVTPHGLRAVQDRGSWYSWIEKEHGPFESAITNENGLAELPYPKWVSREAALVTSTVCLIVEHPDYCVKQDFECQVDNVGRVKPVHRVQLKQGGRMRVQVRRENTQDPIKEVYGLASNSSYDNIWNEEGTGKWISPTFTPGLHVVRVVDRTDPANLQFSDPIIFDAVSGKTEDHEIVVHPGKPIRGRLEVPQPVKNGYVIVSVNDFSVPTPTSYEQCHTWKTWAKVSETGEFEIRSVPPTSSAVTCHAWCDGYVSQRPEPASIPAYALTFQQRVLPQFINLDDDTTVHSIPMEPCAKCEIHVTDSIGRPLEGITISFWPNIVVGINGSTGFGMAVASEMHVPERATSMAERLREGLKRFTNHSNPSPDVLDMSYGGVTDAKGVCLVTNLPGYQPEGIEIQHEKWVVKGADRPPFRSGLQATLKPDEVTKLDVVLVPKPALTPRMLKVPEPSMAQKIFTTLKQFLGL